MHSAKACKLQIKKICCTEGPLCCRKLHVSDCPYTTYFHFDSTICIFRNRMSCEFYWSVHLRAKEM